MTSWELCQRVTAGNRCTRVAEWGLRLHLWAPDMPREAEPTKTSIIVRVCGRCRRALTPEDKAGFFGSVQSQQIGAAMQAAGYAAPDRAEVHFVPIAQCQDDDP